MTTVSTTNLVAELCSKNEKAFIYLYDNYSAALFRPIKKRVKCQLTAEEILQNVFVKAWLHIDMYSVEKGSLYTWLVSIARHETIDYLRSKQARDMHHTSHVVFTSFFDEMELKERPLAEKKLDWLDFLKSLYLLPHIERTVVELWHMGFTCRETGQLLGMPEGSVKTKMRTAYKKLRQYRYGLHSI